MTGAARLHGRGRGVRGRLAALGGVLILAGGFFDLVDGVVARHRGIATRFGAFLDSTLDRWVDVVLLVGISVHYAREGAPAARGARGARARHHRAGLVHQGARRARARALRGRPARARRARGDPRRGRAVRPARRRRSGSSRSAARSRPASGSRSPTARCSASTPPRPASLAQRARGERRHRTGATATTEEPPDHGRATRAGRAAEHRLLDARALARHLGDGAHGPRARARGRARSRRTSRSRTRRSTRSRCSRTRRAATSTTTRRSCPERPLRAAHGLREGARLERAAAVSVSLELDAPAKVNLGLRIVGRRADGYHELESLFAPLDLATRSRCEIESARAAEVTLALAGDAAGAPPGDDNLAVRAARAFLAQSGIAARVSIAPHQAHARGGGARRRIERCGRGAARPRAGVPRRRSRPTRSRQIALGLGADVPFFLDPRPGLGDRDRRAARARDRRAVARAPARESGRGARHRGGVPRVRRAARRRAAPSARPRAIARARARRRPRARALASTTISKRAAVRLCPPIARLRAQLVAPRARARSGCRAAARRSTACSRTARPPKRAAAGCFPAGPELDPGRGDRENPDKLAPLWGATAPR